MEGVNEHGGTEICRRGVFRNCSRRNAAVWLLEGDSDMSDRKTSEKTALIKVAAAKRDGSWTLITLLDRSC